MKSISYILTLLFLSCTSFCQDFNKAKIDSLFDRIELNNQGMGSFSIYKNGAEIYQKAYGYICVEEKLSANKNSIYRIGSISKTFTACIVMQLIDEEKLSLNTRLKKYFPEIPNAQDITIEHLLRHRSGLFNLTSAEDYKSWMEKPQTRSELIKKIIANGTVFAPNEKAAYSNTNYLLLSYIAEKIEQKEYAEILSERITKPLKLTNTKYGDKISTANNEALSYTKGKTWNLSIESHMSIPIGAGGITSTPSDLNSFFSALFAGKVVSDSALTEMKKLNNNYGIGLFSMPFNQQKIFGHTGGIDAFRSIAGYFPDENLTFAYTSNGVAMPMNEIIIGALYIYFGLDYTLPDFKEGFKPKSSDLEKYSGVYSSPSFPLKITISKQEDKLKAQATGQPSFILQAYEKHKFKYYSAALNMEFIPKENKLILLQGGGKFELTKE